MDTLVGQTVADRYAVLSQLGSGGFGSVFMAKHVGLNNPVAIKVLHAHLVSDEETVERFRREAEATSRLKHNAIAGVHDFGFLPDKRPFMVMEFLAGRSLSEVIEAEGALSEERVLPLFYECCDALRYAHRKGLLHRDIKPDNIYVVTDIDGQEHVKLLDFGLAKALFGDDQSHIESLTQSGTALGTPWYMSPEQCQAKPLDGRSDIYSLAYSMYEALAGRRPFGGTTHYEIMHAHLTKHVPPLNAPGKEPIVSEAVEKAILRALSKSPNDRFMTADEFKIALGGPASGTPGQNVEAVRPAAPAKATTPSPVGKKSSGSVKAQEKSPTPVVLAAAIAVVLLFGGGAAFALWWQGASNNTKPQAPAATVSTHEEARTEERPATSTPAEPPVRTEIRYVSVPSSAASAVTQQAHSAAPPAVTTTTPVSAQTVPESTPPVKEAVSTPVRQVAQPVESFAWPDQIKAKPFTSSSAESATTSSQPTTNISAPEGGPPSPMVLPPTPFGGQPLPGNPPPGMPGHVPPPGFPQPPPVPGSQGNQ